MTVEKDDGGRTKAEGAPRWARMWERHDLALWLYDDACRRRERPELSARITWLLWGHAWKSLHQEMKDLFYARAAFALWGRSPRILLVTQVSGRRTVDEPVPITTVCGYAEAAGT